MKTLCLSAAMVVLIVCPLLGQSKPSAFINACINVGSLENGKDADIAMYDGDPFEFTTHCTGTVIKGQVVNEVVR